MTVRALGPLEGDDALGKCVQFNGKEAEMLSLLVLDRNEYVQTTDIIEGVWGPGASNKENQVSKFSLSINSKLGKKEVRSLRNPGRYGFFGSTDIENAENILKSVNAYLHVGDAANALGATSQGLALWRGRPFEVVNSPSPEVTAKMDRIQNLQLLLMQSRLTAHWLRGDLGQLRSDAYEYLRHFPIDFHLNKYHLLAALQRSEGEYYNEAERIKELHEEEGYEFPDELANITDFADERKLFRTAPDTVEVRELRAPEDVGVRTNIPGAMYSDFVRTDELDELRLALDQSLPVIALTALGGRGKRALAHKLCTQLREEAGPFKSIVWISDRELPGSTTLTTVLDYIALTTKNPRLSKGDLADKSFEALASLSSEPTLVVLDHYETMSDPELTSWITRVGGRSKVLLTSIRFPRSIEEHCFEVKVHPPDLAKCDIFFAQLLRRKNLAHLAEDSRWKEYWDAANGNYRLIEWAVGQTGRREHSAILSDLKSGNGDVDIVTSLLFRDSWNSLNHEARMALSTLSLFPYGVTHKQFEAVARISDTYSVMAELMDVDFVTVSGEGGYSLYMVDPLVASRARELENSGSIERWLAEWRVLAAEIGFLPEELWRLDVLDVSSVRRNLEFALKWCVEHELWDEVVDVTRGVRYYYYVRGLWSPEVDLNMMWADAAAKLGDAAEEFRARTYKLNIAAKQGNRALIETILPRLQEILDDHAGKIDLELAAEYRHAFALYLLEKERYYEAADEWRANIRLGEVVLGAANFNANLRWYAICLIRSGQPEDIAEGKRQLAVARKHAEKKQYPRAMVLIDLQLATLSLHGDNSKSNVTRVGNELKTIEPRIEAVKDRRYEAEYAALLAATAALLGDTSAAQLTAEAREKFEAIGMKFNPGSSSVLDAR